MSKGGGAGSRPGGPAKSTTGGDAPPRTAARSTSDVGPRPVLVACADEAAHAALLRRAEPGVAVVRCDVCDVVVEGEPGGRGLFLWSRGEELRWDEPALCEACAAAVSMSAVRRWDIEDEEG